MTTSTRSAGTTVDLTVGTNGIIPCAEVQNGANKYGRSDLRPSAQLQARGGVRASGGSGQPDVRRADRSAVEVPLREDSARCNVLLPGHVTNSGNTATYFYNERGADPVDGMEWYLDTSVEATWRIYSTAQAGFRAEIFNITDRQEKLRSNNVVWCGSESGTGCAAAIDNYGKATSRGSFRGGLAGTHAASVSLLDDLPLLTSTLCSGRVGHLLPGPAVSVQHSFGAFVAAAGRSSVRGRPKFS